jgi:hypothetical protein
MTKTKTQRFLAGLQTGRDFTEGQIRSQFGIANPSATASALRFQGHAVYANRVTLSNGTKAVTYRLGTPSRAVVAAGYRALAA